MKAIINKNSGTRNACAVWALHHVCKVPFDLVNAYLFDMGFRSSNTTGTMTHRFTRIQYSFTVRIAGQSFMFLPEPQHIGMTVNQFNKLQLPGRYIVETYSHWLAQCGYIVYDTRNSERCRIKAVWKLNEKVI